MEKSGWLTGPISNRGVRFSRLWLVNVGILPPSLCTLNPESPHRSGTLKLLITLQFVSALIGQSSTVTIRKMLSIRMRTFDHLLTHTYM